MFVFQGVKKVFQSWMSGPAVPRLNGMDQSSTGGNSNPENQEVVQRNELLNEQHIVERFRLRGAL